MAKETPKKTFVLSNESVNSYGFRILTLEISLNANTVSLYDDKGNRIELNADGDCFISLLNINNQNQNKKNIKLIAKLLGLSENATEAECLAKVQELQELQAKLTKKNEEIANLKTAALEANKKIIEKLVNDAIAAGKLTATKLETLHSDDKEAYIRMEALETIVLKASA